MTLIFNNKSYPVSSASCVINYDDITSQGFFYLTIPSTNENDFTELATAFREYAPVASQIEDPSADGSELLFNQTSIVPVSFYLEKQNGEQLFFSGYTPDSINQTFYEESQDIYIVLKKDFSLSNSNQNGEE